MVNSTQEQITLNDISAVVKNASGALLSGLSET